MKESTFKPNIVFYKGIKFYKYDEGSDIPHVVRVVQFDSVKDEYTLLDCANTFKKIKISKEELEKDWIKLNPDGYIGFHIINVLDGEGNKVPDVMVVLNRIHKEDNSIDKIPYLCCRQAVFDIFALMQGTKNYVAGMCMSQATCPPEIDYTSFLKHEEVKYSIEVAVYMDDHLSDILKTFNSKKFDDTLRLIKARYDRLHPDDPIHVLDDKIIGFCTSLYDLLKENYFMMDFHEGFDIHELKFEEFDFENDQTNRVLTDYVMRNMHDVPVKFYPVKYDKSIDLADIKRKYILIAPSSYDYPNGDITLLAYDVSQTISYKDMVNKGLSPQDAKREAMKQLGWQ